MKISVNWIKQFTDINGTVDELVERIGKQLGEVERVIDLGERYQGVVVAKVVTCEKHPDADKLSICMIDDGGATKTVERNQQGLVQVVCGAPNVKAGLLVAWIPPGAIVPSSYDEEQFKLEVRPLRGVNSNGMLASSSELAISDDHDGILEIDKPAKPGDSFAKLYELDDYIIEIENKMFTHRPDCFGILGVAREIAGIENISFTSPDWYQEALPVKISTEHTLSVNVVNEIPDLVRRFMVVPMSNIAIKNSPIIMQSYLRRLGMKSVNNVVDITNFVMLLTGQPLHAFDYDKAAALDGSASATLVVRHPKKAEKISLLNGKTIEPHEDAIMIATKTHLVGVGGVMGGTDIEIDTSTKNIILEVANFDMYSVRKSSMVHGLFTDAVTRFSKGQSPLQNEQVLAYSAKMLGELGGAQVAGDIIDNHKNLPLPATVQVRVEFINSRLGLKLTELEIKKLLENVEFKVAVDDDLLKIAVPFWRMDIEIPEDVVEEVGRLYGYDKLAPWLPMRDLTPAPRGQLLELKSRVRSILAQSGANELLTHSFVHGDLFEKTGQNKDEAYQLNNALSPDLQYYRLTLTPSLLSKVHLNIKANFDEFALFEISKTHDKTHLEKSGKLPEEMQKVAFVYSSNGKEFNGAPYYQAKAILDFLGKKLGLELEYTAVTDETTNNLTAPFNIDRSAYVTDKKSGTFLGIIGEYRASVRKALKLPRQIAGFEIGTEGLMSAIDGSSRYRVLSRFPSTHQDISFKLASSVTYKELADVILATLNTARESKQYDFRLSALDIYRNESNQSHKHIAFHVELSHPERTLVTDEMNELLATIAHNASQVLKAERL